MIGSHFDYCQLVFLGEFQQAQGYADMVVEVALSMQNIEFFLQYGCRKFFGGGFAAITREIFNVCFKTE
jgi:hypothetical protein